MWVPRVVHPAPRGSCARPPLPAPCGPCPFWGEERTTSSRVRRPAPLAPSVGQAAWSASRAPRGPSALARARRPPPPAPLAGTAQAAVPWRAALALRAPTVVRPRLPPLPAPRGTSAPLAPRAVACARLGRFAAKGACRRPCALLVGTARPRGPLNAQGVLQGATAPSRASPVSGPVWSVAWAGGEGLRGWPRPAAVGRAVQGMPAPLPPPAPPRSPA